MTTLDLLKEARDLLAHSRAYIDATPHGDNCFVSSHYEGDPGDGCNCGKESLTDAFFNDGDDLIARLDAHLARESAQVESVAPPDQRQAVVDAIASALGDAYDCTRVWAAWCAGTMTEDDFVQVAEQEDRLLEIADAAIAAMLSAAPTPPKGE